MPITPLPMPDVRQPLSCSSRIPTRAALLRAADSHVQSGAMTPDTAEFPKASWPAREWTEDEDGIIESVRYTSFHSAAPSPRVPTACARLGLTT